MDFRVVGNTLCSRHAKTNKLQVVCEDAFCMVSQTTCRACKAAVEKGEKRDRRGEGRSGRRNKALSQEQRCLVESKLPATSGGSRLCRWGLRCEIT